MDILPSMRGFSLLFLVIAVVMLLMFVVYVISGEADPLIATGLFVSFLACAAPALYLLKPFESREDLERRREAFRRRREREKAGRNSGDGPGKKS